MNTCAVQIWDLKELRARACGSPAQYVLIIRGDYLFAICHRHDKRLDKVFLTSFEAKRKGIA